MRIRLSTAVLGLISIIFIPSLSPLARASEWDKETVITFNQAVRIPGKDLPAGTYVWRLMDSNSDRNVIEVFSADREHLLATFFGVGQTHLEPSDRSILTLSKGPAGTPERVDTWFYA